MPDQLTHQLDGVLRHTGQKVGLFDTTPVLQAAALTAAASNISADRLLAGTPALAIGSNDDDVASGLFYFAIAGVLLAKAAVATGTALAAGTIPADTWGIYSFEIGADATIDSLAGAANFTTNGELEAALDSSTGVGLTE